MAILRSPRNLKGKIIEEWQYAVPLPSHLKGWSCLCRTPAPLQDCVENTVLDESTNVSAQQLGTALAEKNLGLREAPLFYIYMQAS